MKKKALARLLSGATLLPIGLLALSSAALADNVSVEGSVNWSGKTTSSLSISLDGGTEFNSVRAGEPELTVTDVSGDVADLPTGLSGVTDLSQLEFSEYVWCIDPVQYAASNVSYTWDLVALEEAPDPGPVMGVENAADMRLLFGNVYTDILGGTAPITGVDRGVLFDAFQLAIWEISKETSDIYSLSGGVFQADAPDAAKAQADLWLSALNALNDGTASAFDADAIANNLFALTGNNGDGSVQDYIVAVVPLPAAVWLFGSALLGMVGVGYRRRKQS